mmetsp:Transcript_45690/g.82634  ORF Transcript_45690/g.82634 Transcript_45690/m.82634 type:complete len:500 (-) Transcript_45690:219-1718(-)
MAWEEFHVSNLVGHIRQLVSRQATQYEVLEPANNDQPVQTASAKQEKEDLMPALSYMALLYRMRYLIYGNVFTFLSSMVAFMVMQYVTLTFFAQNHGGGDCELTPSSPACAQAASDATVYASIVTPLCNVVSIYATVYLGHKSDTIGRKPMFVIKGVLLSVVMYAMMLHMYFNVSLWVYLVIRPISAMFDTNGVNFATMVDFMPEASMRAAATTAYMSVNGLLMLAIFPLTLLPSYACIFIGTAAATAKIFYFALFFPETVSGAVLANKRQPQYSTMHAGKAAFRLITSNEYLFRTSVSTTLNGITGVGVMIVTMPYLTAYIGFTRQEGILLGMEMLVLFMLWLTCLAKPLIGWLGEVRLLQIAFLNSFMVPLLICFCSKVWHVAVLFGVSMGPSILASPCIMAIKARLVHDDEQGLVQGVLFSVLNMATTIATPVFGLLYAYATEGGTSTDRWAVFPLLATSGLFSLAAFFAVFPLPRELPKPEDHGWDSPEKALLAA